ncbi:helix-turn-helix domain-containing protein [Amycolatopsis granulosa]|uniref:helix-turn-helix domain-containing protein n=1 Tax=Amycolatopsis granulosa TaxID=185684 RepID=UPI001FBABBD3|nr:XRE family transcriptional regulator [Amycolatopsis granulosa]NIH84611.1 transcriptional regulator with XRE-family HTH domain [Amycolatopsis granulosa]
MRTMEDRLAARLAQLRADRGWSLDDLADRAGVSRSTLSRVERGEISPTATLLGKLCTVYERPMSRLLTEVEADGPQLVRAPEQTVWTDDDSGFTRRSVSPPHPAFRAEVVEGTLRPGADIHYDAPSVPGLEQHLWVLAGSVEVTADGETHLLGQGDCLRFRLWGPTRFRCPGPTAARYLLVLVMP